MLVKSNLSKRTPQHPDVGAAVMIWSAAGASPRPTIGEVLLYIEAVVAFIAVHAQLFAAGDPDPVGAGLLAAAFAVVAVEDLRGGGEGDLRRHGIEELLRRAVEIVALRLLRGHVQRLRLQHQTDRFAGSTVVKENACLPVM